MPHKKAKNIHAPLLGHLPTHNHPALPPAPFIPPILSLSSLTAAEVAGAGRGRRSASRSLTKISVCSDAVQYIHTRALTLRMFARCLSSGGTIALSLSLSTYVRRGTVAPGRFAGLPLRQRGMDVRKVYTGCEERIHRSEHCYFSISSVAFIFGTCTQS